MRSSRLLKILKRAAVAPLASGVEIALRRRWIQSANTPEGRRFRIPPDMNGGDFLNLLLGGHEIDEITVLRKHFRPAANILEIGSNIGVVSRVAYEEKLEPGGMMICVEPDPSVFPCLRENVPRTSGKRLLLENIAVGLPRCADALADFQKRNNLSSGLLEHLAPVSDGIVTQVKVKPMTEVIRSFEGRYSLICDAEGAEVSLIASEPYAFAGCDQIMMEFHDPDLTGLAETPESLIDRLMTMNFSVVDRVRNSCYLTRIA